MNRRKVEDYAFEHKCSFNEAKRRLGGAHRKDEMLLLPERGTAVAGTGKPKGGTGK